MNHFRIYSRQDILSLTKIRKFETRIGERVLTVADKTDLLNTFSSSSAKYIIFGIPEDIGIRANYGIGGADSTWVPFLSSFLNIQSNNYLSGEEILLAGHFDFGDLKFLIEQNALDENEKIDAYRHAVLTVDAEVEELAKLITAARKIPIAIGGGHNNAYPLIKGSAKGLLKTDSIPLAQINCINLDAHADYRPTEGRHSGNGFRYAEEDGFLLKYAVVGIHENYLPQNVLLDMTDNPFVHFETYEDIFLRSKKTFTEAIELAMAFTADNYTGIELDLDSIENILCSAETPAGLKVLDARKYLSMAGKHTSIAYLQICEGATQLINGRKCETTGKMIAYLVTDFLKASNG